MYSVIIGCIRSVCKCHHHPLPISHMPLCKCMELTFILREWYKKSFPPRKKVIGIPKSKQFSRKFKFEQFWGSRIWKMWKQALWQLKNGQIRNQNNQNCSILVLWNYFYDFVFNLGPKDLVKIKISSLCCKHCKYSCKKMGLKVTAKGKEPPKEPKDGQNFMLYSCICKNWYPTDVKIWRGARETLLKMCILVLNDSIQAKRKKKKKKNSLRKKLCSHHFSYQSFTISNTYFSIHIPREKGD